MRVLLDADSVSRGLRRVAGEIVERHRGVEGLVLVAVRRGGIPVADRIAYWIRELERRDIPVGSVDVTLYRDDAATALPNPRIGPSDIPCALEGARVVLVDDVLFTGRNGADRLDGGFGDDALISESYNDDREKSGAAYDLAHYTFTK